MTVLDSLRTINAYPVPQQVVEAMAVGRGLQPDASLSPDLVRSPEYRLAKADLLMWLSGAPDVTQEGISYSFTDEQRGGFRISASAIYAECGDAEDKSGTIYGYKGDRL